MSIRLEDMSRICENYKNVRKKVVSVLGKDMLNSNHYGSTILYNETINTKKSNASRDWQIALNNIEPAWVNAKNKKY